MAMADAGSGRMQVISPLDDALQHTKRVLFQPFDFVRWIMFGVIIFMDIWLGGNGNGGFNLGNWGGDGGSGAELDETIRWAYEFVVTYLGFIIAALVVVFAIGMLFLWLSSRGQLMFVRAVAVGDPSIGDHWRATGRLANSLFLFRLVFSIVAAVAMLATLGFAFVALHAEAQAETENLMPYLTRIAPLIAVFAVLVLAMWIIQSLLRSFVAPIMLARNATCLDAWREFGRVASGNILSIAGFFGVRILYSLVFGIAAMVIGCMTCCFGFLPVIHHALFAPYYVFDRAYPMFMLRSASWEYDLFEMYAQQLPTEPPPINPRAGGGY